MFGKVCRRLRPIAPPRKARSITTFNWAATHVPPCGGRDMQNNGGTGPLKEGATSSLSYRMGFLVHGVMRSNSVNPSGWCDTFAGKSLLYDEAARLTVLLRITAAAPDTWHTLHPTWSKGILSPVQKSCFPTQSWAFVNRVRQE
jgi:hypothetical protein